MIEPNGQLELKFETKIPQLGIAESAPQVLEVTDADRAAFVTQITKKHSELEAVDISIDGFAPWSNSKYKSLKKCPLQFYLKYILKIKIPENYLIQSDPVSANVGKAAHEILESILLGKSIDKAYQQTKKSFLEKKLLKLEDWETKVEALNFNITKFKDRIDDFDRKNSIKRILTELRIGVTKQFEPTGFFTDDVWIRGVIDLVLLLDCLDAIVLDHKTGGGQGPITPYEEQLDWYKILLHFGIEKVRGIQTGIHFIGEGEIKMGQYSPFNDIENKLKNTLLMSLDGAIEMLYAKGYFKHVRGYYCKWCEYDNLGCKSGELKDLEKSTTKWMIKTI